MGRGHLVEAEHLVLGRPGRQASEHVALGEALLRAQHQEELRCWIAACGTVEEKRQTLTLLVLAHNFTC